MKGNLVLIGMMGCGKSTVGRILAERLGLELADTDQLIESRERRAISEIFAGEGEGYFREREREAVRELAGLENLVIACGGGLPLYEDSIRPLKERGTVFFLRRDPGETYDAVSMAARPLAQDGRAAFIARFYAREPVYRRWADYVIEAPSAREAASQIETLYIEGLRAGENAKERTP